MLFLTILNNTADIVSLLDKGSERLGERDSTIQLNTVLDGRVSPIHAEFTINMHCIKSEANEFWREAC